jgi:hypothetical protein
MNETKQIQIRGGAIADFTKERKTRKRRTQEQHGGYDVPSPAGAIPFTGANLGRVQKLVSNMSGGATLGAPVQVPAQVLPLPKQAGGKPKLILEPKKKSMKKLHLAPASVSGSHTRRSLAKTRKIRVNLYGMKKRLTRAKEIHKDSRHKDIDHIKKTLIDAKLIKPRDQSKPESTEYDMMLRKTYENYMLLRNRAL